MRKEGAVLEEFDLNTAVPAPEAPKTEMPAPKQNLLSDRLTAAMSHPTRLHAMAVFWEREASPREVAAELGEPLNNVNYHVKQLLELDWIELVAQRPVRGGRVVENFYRATKGSYFDEDDLERLGPDEMNVLDTTIMALISRDVSEAMAAGTFFAHDDNQLTRIPIDVDEEGWRETIEILDRALEELMKVKAAVVRRTAESGAETIPTRVEIMHFESPRPRRGAGAEPDPS